MTPAKMAKFLLQVQPRLTTNEQSASTKLVSSANYLVGRSHEACSSIKMPDLFMQKWHWRPDVVHQHSFCYRTLGAHWLFSQNTKRVHISIGLLDRTLRKNQLLSETETNKCVSSLFKI